METKLLLIASLVLASEVASKAAIIIYTNLGAWDAAVTGKAEVDLASQVADETIFSAGSSLTLPQGQTLSFDVDVEGVQVPSTWATWSGGNSPRVLYRDDSSLIGSFSAPIDAFGLELQPNNLFEFIIQMHLSDGSLVSQLVDGDGGAEFFGWVSTGGFGITEMEIVTEDIGGFALGRMVQGTPRANAVPESGATGVMFLICLGSLVAGGRFLKASKAC